MPRAARKARWSGGSCHDFAPVVRPVQARRRRAVSPAPSPRAAARASQLSNAGLARVFTAVEAFGRSCQFVELCRDAQVVHDGPVEAPRHRLGDPNGNGAEVFGHGAFHTSTIYRWHRGPTSNTSVGTERARVPLGATGTWQSSPLLPTRPLAPKLNPAGGFNRTAIFMLVLLFLTLVCIKLSDWLFLIHPVGVR